MGCNSCNCADLVIPVGIQGPQGIPGTPGGNATIVYFSSQSAAPAGSFNSTTDTLIYSLPITTTGTYLVRVSGTIQYSKVSGYSTSNYIYLKDASGGISSPLQTIYTDYPSSVIFQHTFNIGAKFVMATTGNIEFRGYMSLANTSTTTFNNVFIEALKVA